MADCFIDMQGIELTMLQAATHLDEGRDDPLEVATAKFWAAEGGNRIAHAALHIHGGVSIDVDFPIHRYFLWLKQYEFTLGSATPELLRIGKVARRHPRLDPQSEPACAERIAALRSLTPVGSCVSCGRSRGGVRTGSRSKGGPVITMRCSAPASR